MKNIYLYLAITYLAFGCEPSRLDEPTQLAADSLNQTLVGFLENGRGLDTDQLLNIQLKASSLMEKGNKNAEIAHHVSQAIIHYREVRLEKSISLFLDALQLAESMDHQLYQGSLNQEIARIHFGMGDIEKALNYETIASKIWIELKLKSREIQSHTYQGMMHRQLGDYDLALAHFTEALDFFEKNSDKMGVLPTLDQIGHLHLANGDTSRALDFWIQAYDLSKQMEVYWQVKATQGLAQAYTSLHYPQKGLDLYFEALEKADKSDPVEVAFLHLRIGEIYSKTSQEKRALSHLEECLNLFQKYNIPQMERQVYQQLIPLYEQIDNFKLVIESYKRYIPLNDSLNAQNKSETISRLTTEYESSKKDIQIENQEAEIKTKNVIQYSLIGAILSLLIIIGLTGRNYAIKRQASIEIDKQNKVISNTLAERESLLKEIHHRVKNNLQIIASLLYLQSGKFEDENFKKVLEEGQGRVRSMALIHQKLYENEDLKSIPFGEYLKELVSEIRASFGMGDIQLNIEAENIFFDVDTAVPLGLIVNEMATNAFKYAYINAEKGALSIFLTEENGDYVLNIKDDGQGIPDEIDIKKTKSLGLRLVRMLSQQLEGEFSFISDNGTSFELKFAV